MKANELRLGNLIKIGGNTLETYQTYNPAKVTLAILNGIAGENEERLDAVLSVFQPIPLTEEWLLKFGFKKSNLIGFEGGWQHPNDSKYFIQQMSNAVTIHLIGSETVSLLTGFQYVHQLQNLYFALTGEELILKSL